MTVSMLRDIMVSKGGKLPPRSICEQEYYRYRIIRPLMVSFDLIAIAAATAATATAATATAATATATATVSAR
jgi:hypothetical protein